MCDTERGCIVLLAAVTIVAGCASNTAPRHFLPSPAEAQTEAYGGWIELRLSGGGPDSVSGELLAVSRDSVWVLSDAGWVVAPTAMVRAGKLTAYSAQMGAMAGYTLVGALSTIANGWYLALTAPAWIITGTVAGAHQSYEPVRKTPPLGWAALADFARFPQGMPPDIAPGDLRPKLPATKP